MKKKSQPNAAGFIGEIENKAEAPKEAKTRKAREPKAHVAPEPVLETPAEQATETTEATEEPVVEEENSAE